MSPGGSPGEPESVTLVITTCTNRKRKPVSADLHMSTLPQASLTDLTNDWARRLSAESAHFPAHDIYGGRGFHEALFATELLDAQLMVVSAGLGLIDASTRVPPYACTVLVGATDSVAARVTGEFTVAGWWRVLNAASPFAVALEGAARDHKGLICAALSDAYIDMVADDLLALPAPVLARVRLFTRAPLERVALGLRAFVMPYDDRLDGPDSPIRGTRGDFAGRALHHFAAMTGPWGDAGSVAQHAAKVSAAQSGWRMASKIDRVRYDDATLLDLIRTYWDAERGSSSRLLRRFRDNLGIACEQGRFAELARVVRGERA